MSTSDTFHPAHIRPRWQRALLGGAASLATCALALALLFQGVPGFGFSLLFPFLMPAIIFFFLFPSSLLPPALLSVLDQSQSLWLSIGIAISLGVWFTIGALTSWWIRRPALRLIAWALAYSVATIAYIIMFSFLMKD